MFRVEPFNLLKNACSEFPREEGLIHIDIVKASFSLESFDDEVILGDVPVLVNNKAALEFPNLSVVKDEEAWEMMGPLVWLSDKEPFML